VLTKIDLCSFALLKLGQAPIQSFEDNSAAAQLARTLFDPVCKALLALHPWRFAIKRFDLVKTGGGDFLIPGDILRVLRCPGEVVGNRIVCPGDACAVDAIVWAPVESFPSYFVSLAATKLAMEFCIPLAGDQNVFRMLAALYESELQTAKFIDSAASANRGIAEFSLIRVRI
jgi:hypothetical protein